MNTFTITEAKKILGELLKRAVVGEDIGIISGKEIIALRKVGVASTDRAASYHAAPRSAYERSSGADRVAEPPSGARVAGEALFNGLALEGSGLGDGSVNHDAYIYDDRPGQP